MAVHKLEPAPPEESPNELALRRYGLLTGLASCRAYRIPGVGPSSSSPAPLRHERWEGSRCQTSHANLDFSPNPYTIHAQAELLLRPHVVTASYDSLAAVENMPWSRSGAGRCRRGCDEISSSQPCFECTQLQVTVTSPPCYAGPGGYASGLPELEHHRSKGPCHAEYVLVSRHNLPWPQIDPPRAVISRAQTEDLHPGLRFGTRAQSGRHECPHRQCLASHGAPLAKAQ